MPQAGQGPWAGRQAMVVSLGCEKLQPDLLLAVAGRWRTSARHGKLRNALVLFNPMPVT